jgi:uncharacterized protein involved in exopolysaccharide biosynthesis
MPHLLRRPWWPIAAGVCIGALAALVVVKLTSTPVFAAQAEVAIDPDTLPSEMNLPRMRDALLSDALLHEVIVRVYPIPPSPEAEQRLADGIRERLALWYRRQTRTIEFHYHDRDPVRAAEVVNLFARFFGEQDTVALAAPAMAPVFPDRMAYLAVGVVGGLLGALLVLLGRLGRVTVARFARGH